jgi:hypothetical protein
MNDIGIPPFNRPYACNNGLVFTSTNYVTEPMGNYSHSQQQSFRDYKGSLYYLDNDHTRHTTDS